MEMRVQVIQESTVLKGGTEETYSPVYNDALLFDAMLPKFMQFVNVKNENVHVFIDGIILKLTDYLKVPTAAFTYYQENQHTVSFEKIIEWFDEMDTDKYWKKMAFTFGKSKRSRQKYIQTEVKHLKILAKKSGLLLSKQDIKDVKKSVMKNGENNPVLCIREVHEFDELVQMLKKDKPYLFNEKECKV